MSSKNLEWNVGLFFMLGIGALFILTFRVASLGSVSGQSGYEVTASFQNIGGLKQGSAVTLAGVRVGSVRDIQVDHETFAATATLEIDRSFGNIPDDTSAEILTAGLLGEKYVGLTPGGSDEFLKQGGVIKLTQSALVLENLIGQLVVNRMGEAPAK